MAIINGTTGSDVILGTIDGDRINAFDGDDTIVSGAGNDTIFGGDGNDLYVFTSGFGQDFVGDGPLGASDTVLLMNNTAADIRLTTNSFDQLVVNFDATGESITISEHLNFVSIETIAFGDGTTLDLTGGLTLTGDSTDDRMFGTGFNDVVSGKGGIDTLQGGQGDDTIKGGAGADVLYGDTNLPAGAFDGADRIQGGAGNDRILAGGGNDTLIGGMNDDDLNGLSGADRLAGGKGRDTLTGGTDNDLLIGGGNDDLFRFDDDGSTDTVKDFVSGADVLDFSFAGVALTDLSFSQINGGRDLLIDAGGVAEVILTGLTLADIDLANDFVF